MTQQSSQLSSPVHIPNPNDLPPRTAYTAIEIAAPRQQVWDTLLDLPGYDDWNPFTREFDVPEIAVGDVFTFSVRLSAIYTRRQREIVRIIDPPHTLAWTPPPGKPGQPVRYQVLTETSGGHTRYQTWETFNGLAGWIIGFTVLSAVQRGFSEMAQALKAHVESQSQTG